MELVLVLALTSQSVPPPTRPCLPILLKLSTTLKQALQFIYEPIGVIYIQTATSEKSPILYKAI